MTAGACGGGTHTHHLTVMRQGHAIEGAEAEGGGVGPLPVDGIKDSGPAISRPMRPLTDEEAEVFFKKLTSLCVAVVTFVPHLCALAARRGHRPPACAPVALLTLICAARDAASAPTSSCCSSARTKRFAFGYMTTGCTTSGEGPLRPPLPLALYCYPSHAAPCPQGACSMIRL